MKHTFTPKEQQRLLRWFGNQTPETITDILIGGANIERSRMRQKDKPDASENVKFNSFLIAIKNRQMKTEDSRTADIDSALIEQYKAPTTKGSPKKDAILKHEQLIVKCLKAGLSVGQIQALLKDKYKINVERSYLSRVIKQNNPPQCFITAER